MAFLVVFNRFNFGSKNIFSQFVPNFIEDFPLFFKKKKQTNKSTRFGRISQNNEVILSNFEKKSYLFDKISHNSSVLYEILSNIVKQGSLFVFQIFIKFSFFFHHRAALKGNYCIVFYYSGSIGSNYISPSFTCLLSIS